jgi:predicted secreted protein
MFALRKPLSFNAKRALLKGTVVGLIVMAVYGTIVVVTTPNLPPVTAIATAFRINPLIIGSTAIAVGA